MSAHKTAAVDKALRRAYGLGQKYWQQADSDSFVQHKRSEETAAQFSALKAETMAMMDAAPQATPAATVNQELLAALRFYAEPCDATQESDCGYAGNMCCKRARAAIARAEAAA